MRVFEGAGTIATSPDRLFGYLTDARHLTEYFPKALAAKPGDGEELAIVLDIDGQAMEVEAWFRADEQRRIVQWGVPEAGYQGWMAVTGGPAESGLVVHVQKPGDGEVTDPAVDSTEAEIFDSISTLQRIMVDESDDSGLHTPA